MEIIDILISLLVILLSFIICCISGLSVYTIIEAIINYRGSDEENKVEKEKIEKYSEMLLEAIEEIEEENNSKILFIVDDVDDWKKYKDEIPSNLTRRMITLYSSSTETFFNWYSKVCEEEGQTLDVIIYTDGGCTRMCDIVCKILNESKCEVNTYIPYHAFSSGTLVAFSSDNIYMNNYSFLSPVDAQSSLNNSDEYYSSDAYLKLLENVKNLRMYSNSYLSTIDNSKLHDETLDYLREIFIKKGLTEDECNSIIEVFGSGKYSHSSVFSYKQVINCGLDVTLGIPDDINNLFSTYLKIAKNIKKIKGDNNNDSVENNASEEDD